MTSFLMGILELIRDYVRRTCKARQSYASCILAIRRFCFRIKSLYFIYFSEIKLNLVVLAQQSIYIIVYLLPQNVST